jgi:hypothetical protein
LYVRTGMFSVLLDLLIVLTIAYQYV